MQHRPLKDELNFSLLSRIAKNDSDKSMANAAFDEFYCRFHVFVWNLVYRVCNKFSKDPMLSEDIFQEVFIRVYSKSGNLIENKSDISEGSIKAWLSKIARNILIDYIRSNSIENYRTDYDEELHDSIDFPQHESDNQNIIDGSQSINLFKLEAVIAALDTRERDILYLYMYSSGRKVSSNDLITIAKKYGVTTDTIRKTYYRTLEKIQTQVKKQ